MQRGLLRTPRARLKHIRPRLLRLDRSRILSRRHGNNLHLALNHTKRARLIPPLLPARRLRLIRSLTRLQLKGRHLEAIDQAAESRLLCIYRSQNSPEVFLPAKGGEFDPGAINGLADMPDSDGMRR
jgi:hypothetical protein